MKIIAIGDIHGRYLWKEIVEKEKDTDVFVFVGDYFDTHEDISSQDQLRNFLEIINLKVVDPDKFILLLGNHDFHYLNTDDRYSGYNQNAAALNKIALEKEINEDKLQICYQVNGLLFSHAGFTKTWCSRFNIDIANIENEVNILFKNDLSAFKFAGTNPYGDSTESSPIWVRPRSLTHDRIDGYKQIVGHTQQDNMFITGESIGSPIFIDTLGTSREYIQIVDDLISIKEVK